MGTVSYMSPEQARGEKIDSRTDLFSFGAVLYEMATGQLAFDGDTTAIIYEAVMNRTPTPPKVLNPALPPKLEEIIIKAMEKDRDLRYQTASDMRTDFERLKRQSDSAGRTPSTKPDSGKAARAPITSLAVLPLMSASSDPEMEYLSRGITESIINSLSKLPKLRVLPGSVTLRYKGVEVYPQQAGRDLKVGAVLAGRVLQRGDTLTIAVELVDVANGWQLWGERYARPLSDISSLEEEIAREISEKLRLRVSSPPEKRLPVRRAAIPSPAAKHMLAILPFENLGGDEGREYLSDGLTEETILQIGSLCPDEIGVIARTSSMQYKHTPKTIKQIGAELGVNFVLEGTVRQAQERVRVTAQLIQVSDETHIWARVYERDLADVLGLQCDVARGLAEGIRVKLSPKQEARLSDFNVVVPEAFESYSKGRFCWNKRTFTDLQKAIHYFERAIKVDPNYAAAYAGLADCYIMLGSLPSDVLPPRVAMPKSKEAAKRAIALNKDSAEAHASLAYVEFTFEWNWAGAEKGFKRALELNPNYATAREWYALYLAALGRMDDALGEIRRAAQVDPLSPVIYAAAALIYLFARRYDEALEHCRKAFEFDPNFLLALYVEGRVYEQKRMFSEAIEVFQRAKTLSGGIPMTLMALGTAYALSGDKIQAERILEELQALSKGRYLSALYPMAVCVTLGDMEQALQWLQRAFEERSDYLVYLAIEPGFDNLRADPRFSAIMRQIGLLPE